MLRSVYLYLIEKLKPFSFYLDGILHIFFLFLIAENTMCILIFLIILEFIQKKN